MVDYDYKVTCHRPSEDESYYEIVWWRRPSALRGTDAKWQRGTTHGVRVDWSDTIRCFGILRAALRAL